MDRHDKRTIFFRIGLEIYLDEFLPGQKLVENVIVGWIPPTWKNCRKIAEKIYHFHQKFDFEYFSFEPKFQ